MDAIRGVRTPWWHPRGGPRALDAPSRRYGQMASIGSVRYPLDVRIRPATFVASGHRQTRPKGSGHRGRTGRPHLSIGPHEPAERSGSPRFPKPRHSPGGIRREKDRVHRLAQMHGLGGGRGLSVGLVARAPVRWAHFLRAPYVAGGASERSGCQQRGQKPAESIMFIGVCQSHIHTSRVVNRRVRFRVCCHAELRSATQPETVFTTRLERSLLFLRGKPVSNPPKLRFVRENEMQSQHFA